jgi:cytochrome c6
LRVKLTVLAVLAAALFGCGGSNDNNGGSQQASSGKQVFDDAGCANCHTLKAAGAGGRVGPDLDQLKPAADLVERQVTNGGGGMPSFKSSLSPDQIKAVADYVAANAGK